MAFLPSVIFIQNNGGGGGNPGPLGPSPRSATAIVGYLEPYLPNTCIFGDLHHLPLLSGEMLTIVPGD